MKSATIPPVRIDPAFRKEMEQELRADETLAALVETSVRHELARRQAQAEFVRRGLAAIERTVADRDGVPADALLARLEEKLVDARRRQQG